MTAGVKFMAGSEKAPPDGIEGKMHFVNEKQRRVKFKFAKDHKVCRRRKFSLQLLASPGSLMVRPVSHSILHPL